MHQTCLSFLNRCIRLALLCSAAASFIAQAQNAGPNEKIYMYKEADRDQRLIEKAKQEGALILYTSSPTARVTPMAKVFETKYGIKLEIWRANSDKIVQRAISEAQGKRNSVDVIETNGPDMESMAREKLLSVFYSPYIADVPSFGIPPHRQWISDRMNVIVMAYNTNKVRKEELPKNFEGFLDPKWKGRIGIESTDSDWMATFIKIRGQEQGMNFFKKLSEMRPDVRTGHILLAELVAAGEIPIGLTVYNTTVETIKQKGAPIDWVALDPVIARPQGIGVAKNAPHPHAALLYADFVLSPEGQKLLESVGDIPTSIKVKSKLSNFKYDMTDSAAVLDAGDKWDKIWNELILKK